jgi:pimeloyl-ACP methyl ester carboxylesterase
MHAGDGPAMIIVPATISNIDNWENLVDFVAQWFEVYFFELPGHGNSSPFQQPFTTSLVATLVEQLADSVGFTRFNLMGFSFGGILTMQTYLRLHERIDRVVMVSPCLTWRAIQMSAMRRAFIISLVSLFKRPSVRKRVYHLIHDAPYTKYSASIFRRIGNIESTIPMDSVLQKIKPVTLEILTSQLDETLRIEFPQPRDLFTVPCYFAMSVNDPLLDYETTLVTLQKFFAQPSILELNYPFHQSPRPFTFDELNCDFRETIEAFLAASQKEIQPVQ